MSILYAHSTLYNIVFQWMVIRYALHYNISVRHLLFIVVRYQWFVIGIFSFVALKLARTIFYFCRTFLFHFSYYSQPNTYRYHLYLSFFCYGQLLQWLDPGVPCMVHIGPFYGTIFVPFGNSKNKLGIACIVKPHTIPSSQHPTPAAIAWVFL